MKTIREGWASFQQEVLPVRASEVQQQEMRRAFYAGALVSIVCTLKGAKNPSDVLAALRRLHAEVSALGESVARGEG